MQKADKPKSHPMNLQFSKEVTNNNNTTAVKRSDHLRLYKVFDEDKTVVGQFFFYHREQFLTFSNKKIAVEVISAFFKKSKHLLVDKSDSKQIGQYEVYSNALFPWDFTLNNSLIKIGDKAYNFLRLNPDIKPNVFKQETWGHFKFGIYPKVGQEFAEFSLKMDIPVWSKPNYTKYRPFTGQIETNFTDIFPILSAFYLFEIEFDKEDNKDSG
jgi:hypothetical protein